MKPKKIVPFISILIILQIISLTTIFSLLNKNSSLQLKLAESPPKIENIEFLDMNNKNVFDGAWATVPPDGKLKIRFNIKGNYTAIDMFITPTGSQMYLAQKRIDIIYFPALTSYQEAEYIWEVPKGTMGHFEVIIYNGMVGTKSDSYGVKYE